MAYDSSKMRLIGGYPGQQLFMYQTTDVEATVKTAGYFNQATADYNLCTGDVITFTSGVAGAAAVAQVVATVSNGSVTVL